MSSCVANIKNEKIVLIPSKFDPALTKLVKEYSLHSKSTGGTSNTSDTDEKVIGHIERVKCEQDVKPSIAVQ